MIRQVNANRDIAKEGKGNPDVAVASTAKAIEPKPDNAEANANQDVAKGGKGNSDVAMANTTKASEPKSRQHGGPRQSG